MQIPIHQESEIVNQPTLQQKIYGGSVESRLAFALLLFEYCGKFFSEQPGVQTSLERLRIQESELAGHMQALRLGRLCAACASSEGGSCCSRYMAGETDSLQILINMMAGVDVVRVNHNQAECCYLNAATGCIFTYKPMFCMNYNCHIIETRASGPGLRQLEKLAAALLGSQYELEMLLFRFLSTHEPLRKKILTLPAEP